MVFAPIRGLPAPVARIVLGTASFGALLPGERRSAARTRTFDLLTSVLESGGNAFDTARVYRLGGSERLLGEWMREARCRDRVILVSKGGHPSLLTFRGRVRAPAVRQDLEESLRALRTEHIDLYLLHRDDPAVPVERIVEMLHALLSSGKVRACGVSNWTHERVDEANRFARSQGLAELAVSSPQFSLADWRRPPFPGCVSISGDQGRGARSWYRASGVSVLAWSSLAGGFFAPPAASCRGLRTGPYRTEANDSRLARARQMAGDKGMTTAQIALAYVTSQPFAAFPVVSTRSLGRFRENAEAAALCLTPAEMAWLESGAAPGEDHGEPDESSARAR